VGSEGKHLKLTLLDEHRVTWDAIGFRQGEWCDKLPDRVDIVYHLEANEWNKEPRLQLNVQDVRPAEGGESNAECGMRIGEQEVRGRGQGQ
jgi:hypothetical protein